MPEGVVRSVRRWWRTSGTDWGPWRDGTWGWLFVGILDAFLVGSAIVSGRGLTSSIVLAGAITLVSAVVFVGRRWRP